MWKQQENEENLTEMLTAIRNAADKTGKNEANQSKRTNEIVGLQINFCKIEIPGICSDTWD